MFREIVFENMAPGLSSEEIFQEPRVREVQIVRFEIPLNAFAVNITAHFRRLTVKISFFDG